MLFNTSKNIKIACPNNFVQVKSNNFSGLVKFDLIFATNPEKIKEWEKELIYIYSTLPFANLGSAEYVIGSDKKIDYDKIIDELSEKQKSVRCLFFRGILFS